MRRGACNELGAHLLKPSCENSDLPVLHREPGLKALLLLGDGRFQLLNFFVLFEKLVEQHGVHLLVTHRRTACPLHRE